MTSTAAARHLAALLLDADRPYRARWSAYATRRGPRLNQAAVLRVIARHQVDTGLVDELDEIGQDRKRKDWMSRLVSGQAVTHPDLDLVADAFDLRADDRAALHAQLDASDRGAPTPALRTTDLHEEHELGPDRLPARHRSTHAFVASGRTTHHVFRFDTPDVTVDVLSGGRSEPVAPDPHHPGFWHVPIRLAETLEAGDPTVLVYETRFAYTGPPAPVFRRGAPAGVGIQLTVRFHPDALPAAVHFCTWPSPAKPPSVSIPMALVDAAVTARPVATDGLVGFRWQW